MKKLQFLLDVFSSILIVSCFFEALNDKRITEFCAWGGCLIYLIRTILAENKLKNN